MEMANQRAENNVVSGQAQNSIADFDPQKKPKTKKFAVACAVLASMTSILLGYGNCSLKLMDIVSGCGSLMIHSFSTPVLI